MKKPLVLCCIFCALLCGCSAKDAVESGNPPSSQTLFDASSDASVQIALDAAQTRISYYEELIDELQKEILDLKATIYANKVEQEMQPDAPVVNGPESPSEALFEYTTNNGEATLTAYKGGASEVKIPDMLGDCPVTAIADKAFADNLTVVSIMVPSGVREIGWFAFSGCVLLTDVTLPESLQSISYGAFENCGSALTVRCPVGSYARAYAQSYGLRTVS